MDFTLACLPVGLAGPVIIWAALDLAAVLETGLVMRQIALVRQQQDFVSAMSHELETPQRNKVMLKLARWLIQPEKFDKGPIEFEPPGMLKMPAKQRLAEVYFW